MEKYTVIIPTRDRAETLEATLRTCVRQSYSNFEIIVCDNCSQDNTREIVDSFLDDRIRYINPGKRLSMAKNFEYALSHVEDGFLMFIGSDDGLFPDAINYVNSIVEKYHVDAVSCTQATYVWPDFFDPDIAGRITLGTGLDDIEIRKSSTWIKRALNFEGHYCFDLPNLYCGFVKKSVINKAYKDGIYFRSITPDAYSAFATAIFLEKYAFSLKPFVIAGASIKSNGASSLSEKGDNTESSKFYTENEINFYEGFVNCPSFEVICAETFAQLSQAFPERCRQYAINYQKMFKSAVKNTNERTRKTVIEAVSSMRQFHIALQKESLLKDILWRAHSVYLMMIMGIKIALKKATIVQIEHSYVFGVNDVDDASLFSQDLPSDSQNQNFKTNKNLLFKKITSFLQM